MDTVRVRSEQSRPLVGAWMLWFAVLGGVAAWATHLVGAWGLLELACLHGNPGAAVQIAAYALTGGPLLVALAATVVAVLLRVRRRSLEVDELAAGRVDLLTHVAVYLNILCVAAIVGGGVALLVLEQCS